MRCWHPLVVVRLVCVTMQLIIAQLEILERYCSILGHFRVCNDFFRYEAHYLTELGRKKGKPLSDAEKALFNRKRSKSTQKKYDDRRKMAKVCFVA